jgi:hypothetical protein
MESVGKLELCQSIIQQVRWEPEDAALRDVMWVEIQLMKRLNALRAHREDLRASRVGERTHMVNVRVNVLYQLQSETQARVSDDFGAEVPLAPPPFKPPSLTLPGAFAMLAKPLKRKRPTALISKAARFKHNGTAGGANGGSGIAGREMSMSTQGCQTDQGSGGFSQQQPSDIIFRTGALSSKEVSAGSHDLWNHVDEGAFFTPCAKDLRCLQDLDLLPEVGWKDRDTAVGDGTGDHNGRGCGDGDGNGVPGSAGPPTPLKQPSQPQDRVAAGVLLRNRLRLCIYPTLAASTQQHQHQQLQSPSSSSSSSSPQIAITTLPSFVGDCDAAFQTDGARTRIVDALSKYIFSHEDTAVHDNDTAQNGGCGQDQLYPAVSRMVEELRGIHYETNSRLVALRAHVKKEMDDHPLLSRQEEASRMVMGKWEKKLEKKGYSARYIIT